MNETEQADEIGLDIQNSKIINELPIFEIEGLKIKTHSKTHFLLENIIGQQAIVPINDVKISLGQLFEHYGFIQDKNVSA